jgi:hypothetical protein
VAGKYGNRLCAQSHCFRSALTDARQSDILLRGSAHGDRMQRDRLKRLEFITLLGEFAAT